VGCESTHSSISADHLRLSPRPVQQVETNVSLDAKTGLQQASAVISSSHTSLFAGQKEMSLDSLITQVLARNPSLAQMSAAWQAATVLQVSSAKSAKPFPALPRPK
jgi:hypothetical protein